MIITSIRHHLVVEKRSKAKNTKEQNEKSNQPTTKKRRRKASQNMPESLQYPGIGGKSSENFMQRSLDYKFPQITLTYLVDSLPCPNRWHLSLIVISISTPVLQRGIANI